MIFPGIFRRDPRGSLPLRHVFRAFSYRSYRLFFFGQSVSLTGNWMTLAAMGWLIHRLTGDPFMLGLMWFFLHIPTFILAPLGGAVSDRLDRRTVMIACFAVNMAVMLLLAGLTLGGLVQVWQVMTVCAVLGVTKGFEMPARQALVADVVEDREHLSNAIALNSSIFHGARLVGPMIAGGLIIPFAGAYGEGICFLLDGLSYIAALAALTAIRLKPRAKPLHNKRLLADIREGFSYVLGFVPMRALILLSGALALFGLPYSTLLPVFAEEILEGGPGTYGILLSAGGVGALSGAIFLASRPSVLGLGRLIGFNTIAFAITIMVFALSTHLWLSTFMLVIAGGTSIVAMVGANTVIQTLVDDERRGRVMSLFGMTFMGALPLGALVFGKVARLVGAPQSILAGAVICMAVGIGFILALPRLRRLARPVYEERGILARRSHGEGNMTADQG